MNYSCVLLLVLTLVCEAISITTIVDTISSVQTITILETISVVKVVPTANGAASANASITTSQEPVNEPIERLNAATGTLPLSFYNNLGPRVNAYVTGNDINNQVVILQPDGTFFYPSSSSTTPDPITRNVAISLGPKGSTTSITIPAYLSSARIWFADGSLQFFVLYSGGETHLVEPSAINPSDPSADVNWGFVELTWNSNGVFANLSYVDFVGLPLGISLTSSDGSIQSALGLAANAVRNICNELIAQAAIDNASWDALCKIDNAGNALRVLAPIDWISITPSNFGSYWTDYINQVWLQYSLSPLTINTQETAGNIDCKVAGGLLQCAGDNRGYVQPTAGDIFGCNSGPFAIVALDNDVHKAIVPRLCAAFNRSTLLLSGGNIQPSLPFTSYYNTSPTNHYSRIVHQNEIGGTGYTFSYDDVNPNGENQSGAVSSGEPAVLAVTVGGPR